MSGLAIALKETGHNVSGSDSKRSQASMEVESRGVHVHYGVDVAERLSDADVVVYSTAVKENHPELLAAEIEGITTLNRGAFLGTVANSYSQHIAVAGTHGKSTTSSLIYHVMRQGQLTPSASIGALLPEENVSSVLKNGEHIVTEACEYHNNFRYLTPNIAVVTNVEHDHVDHFPKLDDAIRSFCGFVSGIKAGGAVVVGPRVPEPVLSVAQSMGYKVLTYGSSNSSASVSRRVTMPEGEDVTIELHNEAPVRMQLRLHGDHNVENAMAALLVGKELGLSTEATASAISSFGGIARRTELVAKYGNARLYDDLACHPNELAATLEAVRRRNANSPLSVFIQPNSYTRLKVHLEEFADCFANQDRVFVLPAFAGRDSPDKALSSELLVDKIEQRGVSALFISEREALEGAIIGELASGRDVILIGPNPFGDLLAKLEATNARFDRASS